MTELLPLMSYCLVMSGTPGPNNLMLTTTGANHGYRLAVPQILGINLGVAVQTWACCMGLGSLFAAYPLAHQLLRVVGTLYLVFLAWKLSGLKLADGQVAKPLGFGQAAMFQMVNPKTWVKSITLASVFMPQGMGVMPAATLVAFIGVLIGFPCASMWALFGVAIRRLLKDPRKRRIFNLVMGGTLVALAVLLFLKA